MGLSLCVWSKKQNYLLFSPESIKLLIQARASKSGVGLGFRDNGKIKDECDTGLLPEGN